jgi:hypothetical protein
MAVRHRQTQEPQNEKCGNLVAAALKLYLVLPGNDYSKIWFGRKRKRKKSEKDNAEAQRALRFAEE